MSSTLVSSFIARAEELSSPYVATLRQRSSLVDSTALKVVELAKQYEVEAYVKKADELAAKAATETLARRTKYAEQVRAFEVLASTRADALAASVISIVDRVLPEEAEDAQFEDRTAVATARALPRVVYRRGNKAAQHSLATLSAKSEATATVLRARRDAALRLALEQRDLALAYGRRGTSTLTAFVDDLRDEADLRTLPLRDALHERREVLLVQYRAALAKAAAKRGVYTQLAWAKVQEVKLDEYAQLFGARSAALRAQLEEVFAEAKLRAVAKSGEARTLFVEYRHKVVAITVSAKAQITVQVVAVRGALEGRWAEVKPQLEARSASLTQNLALARTQVEENVAAARAQLTKNAEETRRIAKERTAALIAQTKARAAEQRAKVEEAAAPLAAQLKEGTAVVKTRVMAAAKETPAFAGQMTARVLGEERGMQVEKQVAYLLEALPVVAVA